ncbi:MAG: DUF2207 domain-containing protein [Candidatus Micrarchaeia archaeon]
MGMKNFFLALLLCAAVFSFSIDSYYTHATVLPNGDLNVYEKMDFTLEKEYNEGYRSIRPEDFGSLSDIIVKSVKVNGKTVAHELNLNGNNAEIVWKKTFAGKNAVEIEYAIKKRVDLYSDFAKVCYEHYGANWQVAAKGLRAEMTLPEGSRGKDMHFEIYSAKQGSSAVQDLTIVSEIADVPAGNYVGGCYLFDKGAVGAYRKTFNESALAILKNEREIYGSKEVFNGGMPGTGLEYCCVPVFIILLMISAVKFAQGMGKKKLAENILPPDEEEPAVVSALVVNDFPEKDLFASTLLDLINKGVVDIVELEKKGETSAEAKRERTILMLRKRPADLKPYEQALLDMIFSSGKEVDLDRMADEFKGIKTMADAKKLPIQKNMDKYLEEVKNIVKAKGLWGAAQGKQKKYGMYPLAFFAVAIVGIGGVFSLMSGISISSGLTCCSSLGIIALAAYLTYVSATGTSVPKGFEQEHAKWDAFYRAVKMSRMKEYPPASAIVWGKVLVYATALGVADKVKSHLSELDALIVKKVEGMDRTRVHTYVFYHSAMEVRNLSKYGTRHLESHSGFSGHSSGGWSSGGGGFSGGSSGGGGFR